MVKLSCSPVGACSFDGAGPVSNTSTRTRTRTLRNPALSCGGSVVGSGLVGALGPEETSGGESRRRERCHKGGEIAGDKLPRAGRGTRWRSRTRSSSSSSSRVFGFERERRAECRGLSRQRAARLVVVPGRVEPDRVVVRVAGDLAKVRGSSRERLTADGIGDSVHQ